jgi:hypothetical protein
MRSARGPIVTAQLGFPSANTEGEFQESIQGGGPANERLDRGSVLFGEPEPEVVVENRDFINLSKLLILAQHQYACSMLLRHFLTYLSYLFLIAIIIMLQRDAVVASSLRAALSNCFLFSAFRDEGTYELTAWLDILDFHDFWLWHMGPFLDGFYQDTYENGQPRNVLDRQRVQVPPSHRAHHLSTKYTPTT